MEVVGLLVYACDYPIDYVVRIHLESSLSGNDLIEDVLT